MKKLNEFSLDDIGTIGIYIACFIAALIAVCGCSGCACFQSSRVEARASYNVLADDCEVSLVAVGYNHQ